MCFLTFLIPIHGLFYILTLFVTIDTIFATYTVVKLHGWKHFRSALLRKGLGGKIWLYYGTTLLVFLMEIYLIGATSFGIKHLFTKGLVGVWCSNELRSVDENSVILGNRTFMEMIKDTVKTIVGIKKDVKKIIK